MNEEHFFGIAKHKLKVVATDGAYIKPITTDYIMITPGQTMDVLVTASLQRPAGRYYMASRAYLDANAGFDNTTTTAILQYNSANKNANRHNSSSTSSKIPFPTLPDHNDSEAAENFTRRLKSLASQDHPVNVPKNITERLFITVSVNALPCPNASCAGPDGNRLSASLNNVSFVTPSIDILQAYYRYGRHIFFGEW